MTSEAPDGHRAHRGDLIRVSAPARGTYVPALRNLAIVVATQCDFGVDTIEDLQMAVDEACTLLLPHTPADGLFEASFAIGSEDLTVVVSVAHSGDGSVRRDGLSWVVLSALTADLDVTHEDARLSISFRMPPAALLR